MLALKMTYNILDETALIFASTQLIGGSCLFEAPYSGNLWQTDMMYGPYLPHLNDRSRWIKKQTFLVAVIDDHSRNSCRHTPQR